MDKTKVKLPICFVVVINSKRGVPYYRKLTMHRKFNASYFTSINSLSVGGFILVKLV